MTEIIPTPEQEAVVSATANSGQSLMIQAYAGAAKTTTLEMASKKIKVPGLALAFNKSIKEEMAKRFPSNFSVQTMNGLGYASMMRALPAVSFGKIEEKKLGKLVSEVGKDFRVDLSSDQWDGLRQLVSKVMQAGIVPNDEGRPLLADTYENWLAVSDELMTEDEFQFLYELGREVLSRDIALVRKGVVSFDDQVYFSTCIEGKFPKFPVLLVDEAQDLSPLNHAMLSLAMRPDGRLLVCGDEKQAIYNFRGADSDSLGKIAALRGDWMKLPLATTFRCPRLIVARQQAHAPGFRAWSGVKEGLFHRFASALPACKEGEEFGSTLAPNDGWGWRDINSRLPANDSTIAILCRNNAPLLGMAFKLIRQRIGVKMLGRDIGQGLISLSRKLFPLEDLSPDMMEGMLSEWEESEVSQALANDQIERVDGIRDKAACLRAVLTFAEVQDAKSLRVALKELFSREDGRVVLSSIHKAKGLEWDVVVHLDPWRIPSKWAKEAAKKGDERQLKQEFNLKYVAETRTRNVLLEGDFRSFV